MCQHVYQIMGIAICPLCSKPTHETDWEEVASLHRQWIKDGKTVQQGWWSI